ncbi:MAG: hypothetical protein CUN55_00545 [Phototrophicales bacterium]|nr:MAG: hypothetical protein CUN55_00545 [Phototrophicales bacterium]
MGHQPSGGIESHLQKTKEAINRWLDYAKVQSNYYTGGDDSLEALQYKLSLEDQPPPERPQVLFILDRIRRYNTLYFNGGLQDQPYILMLELDTAIDTELEREAQEIKNLRLKEEFERARQSLQPE